MGKLINFKKEKNKRIKKKAESEVKDFLSNVGVTLENIDFAADSKLIDSIPKNGSADLDIEFTLDVEVDE